MWRNASVAGLVFLVTLTIQGLVAEALLRALQRIADGAMAKSLFWGGTLLLDTTLLALLLSAVLQIGIWAGVFVLCGEFAEYRAAFYHSAVNFTTLGYGDIVMSDRWRLLGPLEAVNGVLMLSLSASMLYTVFARIAQAMSKSGGNR